MCAMLGGMSVADDYRAQMSDVVAEEPPPVALTVLEVWNLQKLVREQVRRAEKRAQQNAASGKVNSLPGADANVARAQAYAELDEKLEQWLQANYTAVDEAQMEAVGEGAGETVGEARWRAVADLERRIGEVDPARLEVVVVSEGVRGLLGVGREPAVVLARLKGAVDAA